MPAHFGISRTPKTPIVFAGIFGCEKNAGSGPWVVILELATLSPSPSNALGRLEKQLSWLAQGVGDGAFPPCIVSAAEARKMPGFEGSKSSNKNSFFFLFFFSFHFFPFVPTFLHPSRLPSEFRASHSVSGSGLQSENREIGQKCLCIPLTTPDSVKLSFLFSLCQQLSQVLLPELQNQTKRWVWFCPLPSHKLFFFLQWK